MHTLWMAISILVCLYGTLCSWAGPTVKFSDYTWAVKTSTRPVGPGPCLFSAANVQASQDSVLRLRLTHSAQGWAGAEIINQQSLGYGTYTFILSTALKSGNKTIHANLMHPNVVIGLFLWDDTPRKKYREIDWELSRFGRAASSEPTLLQACVQPYTIPGRLRRWPCDATVARLSLSFTWRPDGVTFRAMDTERKTMLFEAWSPAIAKETIPCPGPHARARMNFWCLPGLPANASSLELSIHKFTFTPLTPSVR